LCCPGEPRVHRTRRDRDDDPIGITGSLVAPRLGEFREGSRSHEKVPDLRDRLVLIGVGIVEKAAEVVVGRVATDGFGAIGFLLAGPVTIAMGLGSTFERTDVLDRL
jgi:hypothetical protein